MTRLLLPLFLISWIVVKAQPVITMDNAPTLTHITYARTFDAQLNQPGMAGGNVTWDFSGIVPSDSVVVNYLHPDSVAGGNLFTTANICAVDNNNYRTFYDKGADTIFLLGSQYGLTDGIVYTKPPIFFFSPMTYLDMDSSEVFGTSTGPGTKSDRFGNVYLEADGYGTLVTPDTAISNVLRVKSVIVTSDTLHIGAPAGDLTITSYQWMHPDFQDALIIWSHVHFELGLTVQDSYLATYATPFLTPTGISDLREDEMHFKIFPNPAAGIIRVQLSNTTMEGHTFSLFNTTGMEVCSPTTFTGSEYLFNASHLSSGIYLVKIQSESGAFQTRRITLQ